MQLVHSVMKTPEILNIDMNIYIFTSKFANVGMMWPFSTSDDFRIEWKER